MTSLVHPDVTDDCSKNAVDAIRLGDYFDVDETTSERASVGRCGGTLDVYGGPVQRAVDAAYRAAEASRRRRVVGGARQTTTDVDVDTVDFAPLVGEHGRLAYRSSPPPTHAADYTDGSSS